MSKAATERHFAKSERAVIHREDEPFKTNCSSMLQGNLICSAFNKTAAKLLLLSCWANFKIRVALTTTCFVSCGAIEDTLHMSSEVFRRTIEDHASQ
jgi:hypothetical protein